jgi:hypothetical protein
MDPPLVVDTATFRTQECSNVPSGFAVLPAQTRGRSTYLGYKRHLPRLSSVACHDWPTHELMLLLSNPCEHLPLYSLMVRSCRRYLATTIAESTIKGASTNSEGIPRRSPKLSPIHMPTCSW